LITYCEEDFSRPVVVEEWRHVPRGVGVVLRLSSESTMSIAGQNVVIISNHRSMKISVAIWYTLHAYSLIVESWSPTCDIVIVHDHYHLSHSCPIICHRM